MPGLFNHLDVLDHVVFCRSGPPLACLRPGYITCIARDGAFLHTACARPSVLLLFSFLLSCLVFVEISTE